jgi:hypothetical protein
MVRVKTESRRWCSRDNSCGEGLYELKVSMNFEFIEGRKA